ncbi:N-acetylneuraminate synthase [Bacteroides ovatus]|uniref:N-acetylneuraminate synthase n=1 Tax=Bacteroides ovatus TaxID=28116 RepID=UPI00202DC0EF|nr:N-acetylneuraminate synthase [Bacteroides ovatus]MCM1719093.1 N-acetylneuraminate synthase [Bacteroides ovatus]MCM1755330.1 N-acetylneuraminate synthase [Bacteroides ovatus]MCM1864360.1 N-acetylneuraminate synthase [Bacteroides ovatus]MCM1911218.1 N-acetylneuraminate synthase [Bacteroides ovatus]
MSKTYIIAEAGVNHNGSLELAYMLCDAAKEAGADCVKFQTWQTEKIVTKKAEKASYQSENTHDEEESQFDLLKKLELSYEDFKLVQEHCQKISIDFLSTPDEEYSLAFLMNELHLPLIKIGSGEVTNIPYLRQMASYGKPVILSTGMATLAQVATAYDTLLVAGAPEVSLLHCTTNYPCPKNEVNLKAMLTMKEAFKTKVGYSDHTMGTEIPIAAVAMGAEIIEKHFTLDCNMEGPDHKASLEPSELKHMVDCIRNIETALGDGIKRPNKSEVEISKVVLKSIVAKTPIKKGDLLSAENLTIKRAGSGIPAAYWDIIVGTKALNDYDIDETIKIS